ncbi:MAG TPA: hypothetical protein VGM94_01580 [Galbitalea sp.]
MDLRHGTFIDGLCGQLLTNNLFDFDSRQTRSPSQALDNRVADLRCNLGEQGSGLTLNERTLGVVVCKPSRPDEIEKSMFISLELGFDGVAELAPKELDDGFPRDRAERC